MRRYLTAAQRDRREELEREAYEEAFDRIESAEREEWEREFGPDELEKRPYKRDYARIHELVMRELKQRKGKE